MTYKLTGKDLITFGYEPGKHFGPMIEAGNRYIEENGDECLPSLLKILDEVYKARTIEPEKIPLKSGGVYDVYLEESDDEFESANAKAVFSSMDELVKTPTIEWAAVMPDACPAGPVGTIPVGGVAASTAIHPGMHSADICCSMFMTTLEDERQVSRVLDVVQRVSHFGVGGRQDMKMGKDHAIMQRAQENMFLSNDQMFHAMSHHLGTQGDGNHFFYVGRRESDGKLTFVTHHGSRKPGALLYKEGMKVAEHHRQKISPETLKQNAWIPYDTREGEAYWEALQIIRAWTEFNHRTIHDAVMRALGYRDRDIVDRFWNEHNFVFQKDDLFYHAKGSTPVWGSHAHDADVHGRTIIPLNMGEPILIVKNHEDNSTGFAPHGAGRNMSRTQFMKMNEGKTVRQMIEEQVGHIDARFYTGRPDASELPGAYKRASEVTRQIESYGLAHIVDRILPLGSMMAGEIDKPWLKKRNK